MKLIIMKNIYLTGLSNNKLTPKGWNYYKNKSENHNQNSEGVIYNTHSLRFINQKLIAWENNISPLRGLILYGTDFFIIISPLRG